MDVNDFLNNKNNVYYGHGTKSDDKEMINSILMNGLRCSHDYLFYTSEVLGIGGQIKQEEKQMLRNWPHLPQLGTNRVIIIISLPRKYNIYYAEAKFIENNAYYYKLNEENRMRYSLNDGPYVMPEFICGYYDPKSDSFISNPKYYEFLSQEEQNSLFEQVKENYFNSLEDSCGIEDYRIMAEILGHEFGLTDEEIIKFKRKREEIELLSQISPELLDRTMKLPSGEEIPAEVYLKEIVFPYIPTNGFIVLNNGAKIPVSHFIMECVIFDCQDRYNGDFARYMQENVQIEETMQVQESQMKIK